MTTLLALAAVLSGVAAAPAVAAAPTPSAIPAVTGTPRSGQQLSSTTGLFAGTTPMTYTRRWIRCDDDGETNCTTIAGQSNVTYTLADADVGRVVKVAVTATNVDGSATSTSAPSPVIVARAAPQSSVAPELTGDAVDGQTLTSTTGTWTGTDGFTYARKWYRCDTDGALCSLVNGQTAATYALKSADVGSTIKVQVTATNADGTGFAFSEVSPVVDATLPVNSAVPTVTGTTREGQQLTSSNPGTWGGTTPMTYTRRWQRCDEAGNACAPIDGATGTTYVPAADDVDGTIRVAVTAHNAKGTTTASSAPTGAIGPKRPPLNTVAPAVTGTTVDTQQLTATTGTWTGTATISYKTRWLRCNAAGAACAAITGATGPTYTLASVDVGATLRFEVTATNPDGSLVVESAATAPIDPTLPVATALPAVTGSAREGQLLSVTAGVWKGTPTITHAYQWLRCSSATDCDPIADATNATYRATADDLGAALRVDVVASNGAGAVSARSNPTATVTPGPAVNTQLPTISGDLPRDGYVWTGTAGTWEGTRPFVESRQWLRCSATGASCVVISGAVAPTYKLQPADVGKTVRLEVKMANGQGEPKAQSLQSPVVGAAPPAAEGAGPVVAGDARDGQVLTATGTWSGTPPIALTHQWERCDGVTLTCADVPGQTAATYRLTPADVGSRLRVRVGASNAGGGAQATSAPSLIVQREAPRSTAAPVLSGVAREFETLSATTGTFAGTAPIAYAYQWESCDDAGQGCADIPGATSAQLVLSAAELGRTVRAKVTATNTGGSATAQTALSTVVAVAPPRNTVAPSVSPNTALKDGRLLEATTGGWVGSDTMSFTYRWERCSSVGDKCATIVGAAEPTYRLTTAEVGFTVRVVVSAANGGGGASQASPVTGVVLTNPPSNETPPTLSVDGVTEDGATLQAAPGTWSGVVPFTTSYRWWRCDASGEDCGAVVGAIGSTYTLGPADVGLTVRVQVVQENIGGSTAALSAPSNLVRAAPPRNIALPQIDGGAAVGRLLTAVRGSWSGTPELRYTYQWQRCEADGTACADIPGSTATTYRLLGEDDTKSVRVVVTATNDEGAATSASATTAEVSDDPPIAEVLPTIETPALVAQGALLTGDPGVWSGANPKTYAYQWRRCDPTGMTCVDIAGATLPVHALVKEDVGRRLVLRVEVENVVAASSAETSPTPLVLPEPPSSMSPPVVTAAAGGMRDGIRLTATPGLWKGATPMTYETTWLRCDATGGACAPIPDAIGVNYTLSGADVGRRIRARVSATNAATSVVRESDATSSVAAALPVNGTRPAVVPLDGKPRVGGRVRAGAGAWTGTAPLDLDIQWQRCLGTSLAACDDVPGATGAEYRLTEEDVGRRLRVVVTAENGAGTARAESTTTETIPATTPENTAVPTVSAGPVKEGDEVQAGPGAWAGSAPIAYSYQWERCASAGATTCPKIANATRAAYTLSSADVGKVLRVAVTASNAGGRATASSAVTQEVGGVVPRSTGAPAASAKGGLKVGGALTATQGKWAGTAPMTFTTRWQRCDARGVVCTDIPDAEKTSYVLKADDVENGALKEPIRAVITAENAAGTGEAPTNALGAVAGSATDAGAAGAARKARKKLPKSKVVAAVRKVRFAKGRISITLACPKKAKDRCGVIGSVAAGRFSQGVSVNGIAKGKRVTRTYKLTTKQRKALKRRKSLRLLARFSAPATPTRPKKRRIRVRVPKPLRSGKAAKTTTTTATPKTAAPAAPAT